jgi:histone H3/H4
MNKSALKNYAVNARRDFIDAIRNRAYIFDLDERGEPNIREENLDVIIKNQAYPKKVGEQVKKLAAKIKTEGFNRVVEDIAYCTEFTGRKTGGHEF